MKAVQLCERLRIRIKRVNPWFPTIVLCAQIATLSLMPCIGSLLLCYHKSGVLPDKTRNAVPHQL